MDGIILTEHVSVLIKFSTEFATNCPFLSTVYVIFPELSSERRAALLKTAKGKSEEARVSFRRVRDEIVRDIDVREKAGSIGEDEKFRMKKELEKLADAEGKKIDDALIRKEKEINS